MADIAVRIQNEMRDSLKRRNEPIYALRLDVLRLLMSSIRNKRIEKGSPLEESEILALIKKSVKERVESMEIYQKAGRKELEEKERQEINILKEYLPEEISDFELDEVIDRIFAKKRAEGIDLSNKANFGILMKEVLAAINEGTGKLADGKRVSEHIQMKMQ